MADDALDDLAKEAKAAAEALGKLTTAAKGSQPALQGAGQGAEQAGEGMGKASRATEVWTHALGELAAEGLQRAIDATQEFVRGLPEAASRSEAHERALRQLGTAYGAVQQATNGTVSAEQAAAVQQRALQSGLRLSAQELAAVTARARDFARSTGTDLNQALEQLTDQLVDPGEELRKFGVFLQTGMNAGDALRETLRQLGAQAASTGASQVSLAESMEMATRAQREASDALAGLIAQRLELRDFFTQLSSWINDSRDATDGWKVATDAVVGTLREAVGLRAQIGTAQGQSASGAFTAEAGAIAGRLRARGMNLGGFQFGELGVRGTEAQRSGALALLRQAEAGGVTREQLMAQLGTLMGRANANEAQRAAGAAAAQSAAQAERDREIARRNRASQSASGGAPQAPDVRIDRTPTDVAGLTSFLGALAARSMAQAADQRGGTIATRLGGIDLQRQSAEATRALDVAGQGGPGFMGGMFSRDAGRAEQQQRADRIRVIREQREALSGLLVEAQREEDMARRMGRPIAEVNDLVRQRIGIQAALAQSTRDLVASQEEQVSGFSMVGEKLLGVLDGVAEGVGESVVAALEGSKSFGEAMEEMARSTLRAIAKMAIVEALKNGAMAIAAAATYRYDAAVQHGIAAGMWAGVGIAAGAGVAAMGTGQKPAASAGGGAPAARAEGGGRAARADDRATGGGPLTLVLNVSGAAFTDAGVQQAAAVAIREAAGNGFLRREHLAGLLGG